MISRKLREAIKVSDMRAYEIAHRAGMHPSTLSRIVNGIEDVRPMDERVIRLAQIMNLKPEECFRNEP